MTIEPSSREDKRAVSAISPHRCAEKHMVRQARHQDRNMIEAFLEKAYGARSAFKYPQRWRWTYIENPYVNGNDLELWIAIDNGEIVGQTGAMYNPVIVGNKELNAAWSVDTIVLPAYRGKKIGKSLQIESAKKHSLFLSVRSSFVNRRIKMQFGSQKIKDVKTFIYWDHIDIERFKTYVFNRIRHSSYLTSKHAGLIKRLKLDYLAAKTISAYLKIKKKSRPKRAEKAPITIHKIDQFDGQIDQFTKEIQSHYDFMIARDSVYLNWRYSHQPHMAYDKFMAYKNGRICGYMVVRLTREPEAKLGIIAELCALPGDKQTWERLIRYAVQFFENKVEAVKFATADEELIALCRENGFFDYDTDPLLAYTPDTSLQNLLNKADLRVLIGMGDHDWDQYPLQSLKYKIGWFDLDAWLGKGRWLKRMFSRAIESGV